MSDSNITSIAGKRDSIAEGSIVNLKTGGPDMVVKARTANDAYVCWHNNEGDMLKDWVPIVCLKVKG
jgi:uncharacterized protein YodC (DUF2158 family)